MRPSVLVAGVGPAGATLAACAARGGVAVVCVEAAGGPEPHSRESDLRPRALGDSRHGPWRAGGPPAAQPRVHDPERPGPSAPAPRKGPPCHDGPQPAALFDRQDGIEDALRDICAQACAPVRVGHSLVDASQDADGVRAVVEGREGIGADGPAGCDRAGSPVREPAGIDSDPEPQDRVECLPMDADPDRIRPTQSDRTWMSLHDGGQYGVDPASGGHHL